MPRYRATELIDHTTALYSAAGLPDDRSRIIAELLVEADLMGHDTHGLQLAPRYLTQLTTGRIVATGEPEILSDRGAAILWNGRKLPGVWLTAAAVDLASERARQYGMAAVAIREGRHTACLGAYLHRATEKGQMVVITSTTPSVSNTAPFGGLDRVFSPNPTAYGIPTEGDPILIDMSASITTNNMTNRLRKTGGRYPGKWVQDYDGNASDDPSVLFGDNRGSMLPTGGHDHGQKGYGMALASEALSQGLSGIGRSNWSDELDTAIFVEVFEPDAFCGFSPFAQQMSALAALCRASRPAPGVEAVRLPGERALQKKRDQLRDGVGISPGIMANLAPWAEKFGIAPPVPIGQ
jgi:LDH2 family malate/lactate/ureidoglycolate dehydrogenase